MPAVVHSVASRDRDVINYALSRLTVSENQPTYFDYVSNDDGTVTLNGLIGAEASTTLIVPEQIDGKDITRIAPSAFSNNFNGNNITRVVLPSGLKEIGNAAFENCDKLQSVQFTGSNVTKIGAGAFMNCSALGSIGSGGAISNGLPQGLVSIGEKAFFDTAHFDAGQRQLLRGGRSAFFGKG